MRATRLIILLVVAFLSLPGPARATAPDSRRLDGRLPDDAPVVSLAQPRGTVLDALSAIATQTGWTLVVTAPESATTRPLTIQVSKRPAAEVLDLVLDAGSLRASFADGILRVRSDDTAKSADSWRERRRERRGRHGSERVVFGRSLTIGADETVDKAVAIGGSVDDRRSRATRCGRGRRLGHAPPGRQCRRRLGRDRRRGFRRGGRHARGRQRESRRGDPDKGRLDDPLGGRRASHVLDVQVRLAADARVLLLVIAVLIALTFPDALTRTRAYLVTRPGLSALGGVAILLGFVPLCVLLAVTIIGIPLIPVAALLLVALFLFGFTVSAAWFGERLPFLQQTTPVKTVALGGVVFVLVGLIPWSAPSC